MKDYPPYLDYPKARKPQTNYDLLISKTPEELAEFFFKDPVHLYMKTPQETLDWLKSPVKENR